MTAFCLLAALYAKKPEAAPPAKLKRLETPNAGDLGKAN